MQQEPGDSLPADSAETITGTTAIPGEPAVDQAVAAGPAEPRVDAALRRLDELAELGVHEHPAVFERVHAHLSDVLGELEPEAEDQQPGGSGRRPPEQARPAPS
jgi:hypothetical protein